MDGQHIINKIEGLKSKEVLSKRERKQLQKLEKKLSENSHKNSFKYKRIFIAIALLVLAGTSITGGVWYWYSRPNLPPITMDGHVEQNPPSHILYTDMPEPIQKHMLEHADADDQKGKGVIIHYNCEGKYQCEAGLKAQLEEMAKRYPNVYVAPGEYNGKIILTKLGNQEILEKYDKKKIVEFIEK